MESDAGYGEIRDAGYAPAMLYALGMGGIKTSEQHAALLQRLHESLPKHFDLGHVNTFLQETGNPPLFHIPVYRSFLEGVHVLVEDFNLDVNVADKHGMTALHVAAWKGDLVMLAKLLALNADPSRQDKNLRTPVHYAAMRGFGAVVGLLLVPSPRLTKKEGEAARLQLLEARDSSGRTAYMMARLCPGSKEVIDELAPSAAVKAAGEPSNIAGKQPIRAPDRNLLVEPDGERGSLPTRGDWLISGEQLDIPHDIDILPASKISKGRFKRDYFSVQRPLLITENVFAGNTIWAYWTRDDFLQRYGNIKVAHVSSTETLTSPKAQRTVGDIHHWEAMNHRFQSCDSDDMSCRWERATTDSKPSAFTNTASLQQPTLHDDIMLPKIFQICTKPGENSSEAQSKLRYERDHPIRLVISPSSSGMPMHRRSASWDLLVSGEKVWYLAPPTAMETPQREEEGPNGEKMQSVYEDPVALMKGRLAKLDSLRSKPAALAELAAEMRAMGMLYVAHQLPGETMFIPHDWFQLSMSIDATESVSFSQEFCSWRHTDIRFMPLSVSIHGGEDSHRDLPGHRFNDYKSFFSLVELLEAPDKHGVPQFNSNQFEVGG